MATNPKNRSLSTCQCDTIGRRPYEFSLMHQINYPGATKSWRTTSSRCNNNGQSKWPQLSENFIYGTVRTCYYYEPQWDVNIPVRFKLYTYGYTTLVLTGICKPAFAVCRSKGENKYEWVTHDCTVIDPHDCKRQLMKFTSAIAFEKKFYALSLQGTLAVIEDIDSQLIITGTSKTRAFPSIKARHFKECLLESNGEILLILLIYQKSTIRVDQVEVFRLHLPNLVWVKIENLGDRTFFLEPKHFFWVTASIVGCKSNCFYFNQGEDDGWFVYDLKSNSFSPMEPASFKWSIPRNER